MGVATRTTCQSRAGPSFGLGETLSLSMALECVAAANALLPDSADTSDSSTSLDSSTVSESSSASYDSDCASSLEEQTRSSKVQFSKVSIRTYALTVGDTTVTKPYALTLDWEHTKTEILSINLFEELFSSACCKPQRKLIRGFRKPRRLCSVKRFKRLTTVTGRSPESLYELELERLQREDVLSAGMCSSDEGYVDDETRCTPYELVDVDDYQQAEL